MMVILSSRFLQDPGLALYHFTFFSTLTQKGVISRCLREVSKIQSLTQQIFAA